MADLSFNRIEGVTTYLNSLTEKDGNVIHCVNVDTYPFGGMTKRLGYSTYLGTPDNGTVNTLFSWTKNDGTSLFTYRASGSSLYYSAQGTGAWTICGNGTIGNGAHVSYGTLDNTLVVADGVGSTRHTTNGTAFTDTTLAPVAVDISEYQNRIYAAGTASSLFYSTTGTATDWSPTSPSDSSSPFIPGGWKLLKIFKGSDRLLATKNNLAMYRWDGGDLVDLATHLGPSSPYAIGEVEDFRFWINRLGVFTSNGGKPQLISNAVQNQFYNDDGTGIAGSVFDTAAGGVHQYNYYVSIGTVTDNLVGEQISNAVLVYDYKHNDFVNYRFANFPTAYHSYKDANGVQQLIFGDATGQCYTANSGNSDNGVPIETSMQMVVHANTPFLSKEWGYIEVMTNPGCEAKLQVASADTFQAASKKWVEIGNLTNGFSQFRIPAESARGRLLFIRIYDSGSTKPFTLYGINLTYNLIAR